MKFLSAFLTMCLMSATAFGDGIAVQGEGTATVKPDLAHVSLAVVSDGKTPSEALEKNNVAMTRLFEMMKEQNVNAKDVQTTNLNLEPRYTYRKEGNDNVPVLSGYTVSNQVEICVRDLENLGTTITALVSEGANRLGGFQFGATDTQAAIDAARIKAVQDARRKADLLTSTVGTTLGRVISINEQQQRREGPGYAMRAMADAAPGGMPTPTSGGELSFKVVVNVHWSLGADAGVGGFPPGADPLVR